MLLHRKWFVVATIIFGWLLGSVALSQTDSAINGTVMSESGQPIPGTSVRGSLSKICYPFTSESTTTDANGAFRLEHAGVVVHFLHKDYEPHSFVVQPGVTNVEIRLATPSNDIIVPTCFKPQRNQKQIGWGKYGLRFSVPRKGMKISGGKPDVDYVRYLIRADKGAGQLELWFGPYAMSFDPRDDQFLGSSRFSQKRIVSSEGSLFGWTAGVTSAMARSGVKRLWVRREQNTRLRAKRKPMPSTILSIRCVGFPRRNKLDHPASLNTAKASLQPKESRS